MKRADEGPLSNFMDDGNTGASGTDHADARQRLLGLRVQQRPVAAIGGSIARRGESADIPLSCAQEGLWFLERLTGPSGIYNIAWAVRIRGELDVASLGHGLEALVRRHESLRAAIEMRSGTAVQVIQPIAQTLARVFLKSEHVNGRTPPEREQTVGELLRSASAEPFDLSLAPLMRARLLRLADTEHVLLLVVHHIVFDGWSIGVLLHELGSLYSSSLDGSNLPPLPIQFPDYAIWQRERLASETMRKQLQYWREQLGDLDTLELPTDRPRPARSSYEGAIARFVVPGSLLAPLKALARRENATLFMLLLAAFQVLLMRYSRQDKLAVGVPVAGRSRPELEGLIGYFVNTLVLHADLSGNPSFTELLGRVRHTALDAFTHQELPFDRLVAELKPERDWSRNPLYQVAFSLQNQPAAALRLKELIVQPIELQSSTSKFDLSLSLTEGQGSLQGLFEYSTDLFDAATIERLASHFQTLLAGIAADPTCVIGELPMLGELERKQILLDWNDTAAPAPQYDCLHLLFAAQVQRGPEAVAAVFGDARLSYRELDAKANRLAHYLRKLGTGPAVLVGVCLERSLSLLTVLLGILKAGGAYVPLDPAYPADRLQYMAEDSQIALLVTESSLVAALAWPRERSVLLDTDASFIEAQPDCALHADAALDARPEDPAYLIYTSGSTGRPKGVLVPHRAVVNFLASMACEPGLAASDRLLAITTLGFDIAVLELLLPLTVGAQVIVASSDAATDTRALRLLLESSGANVMQGTPGAWRMLIDAGWRGSPAFKALVGGEALPAKLAAQLLARSGELWNMYGPTETTVWSTRWKVHDPAQGISIGRPIANTQVHVLDPQGQLCPIGVAGEICIAGAGVALGYWKRPELTRERFIADPFKPQGRLYRTGDLGRWRRSGLLEHLGRLDSQVKLRGHRIELGEIEAILASHPDVARAVVVVREDRPGDMRLVAYAVPRGSMPKPAALREHLRALLPAYMLPQHFVPLDAIPLLPNGKTDRNALPVPADAGALPDRMSAAVPATEAEIGIAQVWERLLGVEQVRLTDNFFDLGGHSLLAMSAIGEIESRFGLRLNLRQFIFEGLAQIASTATARDAAPTVPTKREGWLNRLIGARRARALR